MCGIFGIVDHGRDVGRSHREHHLTPLLEAMGKALVHRGPDDSGVALFHIPWGSVGIGMQRLSIIDLAGGRQPMTNQDASITVVCNGEIYNYQVLRRELISKGYRFRTSSDTEVLVHLYQEYGWEFVTRLRGMFAFALWDARTQVLVLGRDRLGIKPLFVQQSGGRVAFASEVRGLLAACDEIPEVKQASLIRLLRLQYVPAPDTVFEGIQKLLPGTVLLVSEQGIETRQYWRPPGVSWGESDRKKEEGEQGVATLLQEAVASHLVSDVPVGAFLSGGLDSSSVVALMRQTGMPPFHTFSVGFDGPSQFTEFPYARQVADRFQTFHHELVVGPGDVLNCLPQVVRHLDEPLTDPAVVPTYLLSVFAARWVKVVLTGEGADELFGGYSRYELDGLAAWSRLVPFRLRNFVADWLHHASVNRRVVQGARALSHNSPLRRHLDWISAFTYEELMELMADPAGVCEERQALEHMFKGYFDHDDKSDSALAGMFKADLATWLPDDLLTKVDRMSMAASLEARVPYLDHPLVEMVVSMPPRLKVRNGVRKAILKDSVAHLVPSDILNRRKMGFEMPLATWIRGPLRGFVTDLIMMEGPPGLFKQSAVERFLGQHLKGSQDRSLQLWSILLVKLWHQAVVQEHTRVMC